MPFVTMQRYWKLIWQTKFSKHLYFLKNSADCLLFFNQERPENIMEDMLKIDRERFIGSNIHYQYFPLSYFLKTQAELGFQGIDLVAMTPHVWINDRTSEDLNTLRDMILSENLEVSVLSPEHTTMRFLLNATESDRYERSLKYYQNCIDAAYALGAKIVSVAMTGAFRDEDPAAAYSRAVETLKRLCGYAEKTGTVIALETSPVGSETILCTLKELGNTMEKVNHPLLKATLDTVSMAEAGESICDWLNLLGERIVYVKLCDGRAGSDHYVWGTGVYPLNCFLREIIRAGYAGPIGLKTTLAAYNQDPAGTDGQNLIALYPFFKKEAKFHAIRKA